MGQALCWAGSVAPAAGRRPTWLVGSYPMGNSRTSLAMPRYPDQLWAEIDECRFGQRIRAKAEVLGFAQKHMVARAAVTCHANGPPA
jgi:hypothetical protein